MYISIAPWFQLLKSYRFCFKTYMWELATSPIWKKVATLSLSSQKKKVATLLHTQMCVHKWIHACIYRYTQTSIHAHICVILCTWHICVSICILYFYGRKPLSVSRCCPVWDLVCRSCCNDCEFPQLLSLLDSLSVLIYKGQLSI